MMIDDEDYLSYRLIISLFAADAFKVYINYYYVTLPNAKVLKRSIYSLFKETGPINFLRAFHWCLTVFQ